MRHTQSLTPFSRTDGHLKKKKKTLHSGGGLGMTFRVYRGHSSELRDTSVEKLQTEARAYCQETEFGGHTNLGFSNILYDWVIWGQ